MNLYWSQFNIKDLHKDEEATKKPASLSRVEAERVRHSRLLHQSIVAALVIILVIAFFARHITMINRFELDSSDSSLILIALKAIVPKKPEPPPPPKPKIIPPPVVKKIPDKVPDIITTKIKPVPKRPKRARTKSAKLQIEHNTDVFATNRSSIGGLDGPDAHDRRRPAANGSPNLTAELRSDHGFLTAGPGDFALGTNKAGARRMPITQPAKTNLKIEQKQTPAGPAKGNRNENISDFLNADVSLVLTSSDLSMGVKEYNIWNKINAEFDRWDKGRYGALPKALKRRGRAMIASFQYADGSGHRFIWLRGNTKLYVHGKSRRNRFAELQQALLSIIYLNTKRGGL